MLKCKGVTHLLSESLDRKLSLKERLSLKFHLAMCGACATYSKQMALLKSACDAYRISKHKD